MGNSISKIFKLLSTYVLRRRQKTIQHSESCQLDEPQSDQSTTVTYSEQTSEPSSLPVTPEKTRQVTTMSADTMQIVTSSSEIVESTNTCSDFYLACRANNIEEVKRLLDAMKPSEIDRLESNGSTALHVACFYGHKEIVKKLLEAGADRAIHNKHQCLPFDEALNDDIKELFFRIPTSSRMVSDTGALEWELIDVDVLDKAAEERRIIKSLYDSVPIGKMFERIEKNYIDKGLIHTDKIQSIRRFFQEATERLDPTLIIKAYTAETDFYKVLNKEIAGGANKYESERRYIIALLSQHPILDKLVFIGCSYRVMQLTVDDLQKYHTKSSFMTKSFLSSSIEEKLAAWFLCRYEIERERTCQKQRCKADGTLIKSWVMCVYHIKHHRTALNIEDLSQYAVEGEILIMPYTVFNIVKTEQVKLPYLLDEHTITRIELEECDQYL